MIKDCNKVIDTVIEYYGVARGDIISKKKTNNIVRARRTAMYILKNYEGLSIREIGDIFGRDHATVVYANECIAKESSKELKEELETILNELGY